MGKLIKGQNDLKTLYPEIAEQWHPTLNGSLLPNDVTPGSHRMVWWKCEKGHEWQSIISNRARLNRSCPYCCNQLLLVGENDLATTNPDLASEWNYDKNKGLTPKDVIAGSHKKVWWKCKKGHEWTAEIKSRNYGIGCPYCANKKVLKGFNDLATVNPVLASEWNYGKNGSVTPEMVTFGSGKKFWWICKNGHEYYCSVDARRAGKGCPVCMQRRRTSFPEQATYYYVKKVFPDAINAYKDIFKHGMELDIYIPSKKVGIEYDGKAYHGKTRHPKDSEKYMICKSNGITLIRIAESNQPSTYLRFDQQIVIPDARPDNLNIAIYTLLNKLGKEISINIERDRQEILSFLEAQDKSLQEEYPDIAKEWNYSKNGNLKPVQFHPGSNEKVWWKCSICGFEWKTSIAERTGRDKTGCPVCSKAVGGVKRHSSNLKEKGSIIDTNPDLLKLWNYDKNSILPSDITEGSGEKIWWCCPDCGYEWQAPISHVKRSKKCCPYCNGKVVISGVNDLASQIPDLLKEWDYEKNTDIDPSKILPGSGKRVWWKCSKCGNEWRAEIYRRRDGNICPKCRELKRREMYTCSAQMKIEAVFE